MKLERETLSEREPILVLNNPWIISQEYVDTYGNHLNEAKALIIFEEERMKLFDKDRLSKFGVLAFVREQHARYHAQVYEGESVDIETSLYVEGARLYFIHQMRREGIVVLDDLVEAAIVNGQGRPTRIPQMLLQEIRASQFNSPQGETQG